MCDVRARCMAVCKNTLKGISFANENIGIKVHLHRNQSEIAFQNTLNTRLLFFIG